MVIRKPVKRARMLFSDFLKGDDPQYPTTEVQNSYVGDYPRDNNQHKLKHYPRSQINNKKSQKNSSKKIPAGKKGMLMDMSRYKEVSIKHMLLGGEMTCLKKFCTGGSDMKVCCSWAQFKGDHIDALEVIFTVLKDVSYIRQDDHRASTTYMIFNNKEDTNTLMSTQLVYSDKPIDLYQIVKIEEDITMVNISNFRDVGIEPMVKLIFKELGTWCEIKDISAWRRFDNNQCLPYGMKVLGCKEDCSYCKEAGHWKSDCFKTKKNITKKKATENRKELKFRFKSTKAKLSQVSADPMPEDSKSEDTEDQTSTKPIQSSLIEKVSSGDESESDVSIGDINQPKIKSAIKYTVNSDDFYDISMDSDMSSPMKIKNEFIPPNPSPKTDSDGYSPLSAHALMASKARMGQISEQAFNKYVSNIDKAPPGSNLAALEPGSDTEHQEMSDIEF
ncbi:hypothetical protein AYI69_g2133 [Smittium culicis]|uniref:CCHC-type domain-containing protein n=1 Tax=Smittium culicis TaxID=133412 RepID=A0A1R1YNA3_9FUNG|nr:hypothetical protein AYI69_g2133 [Smittium culicis]